MQSTQGVASDDPAGAHPMMDATLVRIRDLRLEAATPRGTAHILRGVDLDIGRGRILGLVGESGSGKSSLALCLLRLLPENVTALTGQMVMDGTDLASLGPADMADRRGREIAMIFQDPMSALNPLFTIGTHLVDVLRRRHAGLSRRQALQQAESALVRVGIADPAERLRAYPHQLSGGMRQRVMVAMALLAQPELLLADEPTTALDATIEAQIVDLFRELRTSFAGSILFISHHLGLVAELCDDIAVMYGGNLVERGPVAAVCAAPKHPYTAALLSCELDETPGGDRLVSIPGEVPDPLATPPGCIFAPRCALAEDRCRTEPQPLRRLGSGDWQAACWKAA